MVVYRSFLFAICIAILTIANMAPGSLAVGTPNDKLNHLLAFAVLAPLTVLAFPKTKVLWLFGALMLFNAGIEVCQAMLNLGREPDFADWYTGVIATIPVLGTVAAFRLVKSKNEKRRLRSTQSGLG